MSVCLFPSTTVSCLFLTLAHNLLVLPLVPLALRHAGCIYPLGSQEDSQVSECLGPILAPYQDYTSACISCPMSLSSCTINLGQQRTGQGSAAPLLGEGGRESQHILGRASATAQAQGAPCPQPGLERAPQSSCKQKPGRELPVFTQNFTV